jgi:hypothetical protein
MEGLKGDDAMEKLLQKDDKEKKTGFQIKGLTTVGGAAPKG